MAEMVDIGTTYEGRVIEGIRLGKRHAQDGDDDGDKGRKEVVIVAGAHGREVSRQDGEDRSMKVAS